MTDHIYRGDALCVRWSDSSRGGRTVTFQIDAEGPHQFKGYEGERFAIMVVPIGNDEKPLVKDVSPPPAVTKPKQRWKDLRPSARAALLTKDPEFWKYVQQFVTLLPSAEDIDETFANEWLKGKCGIQTKATLDKDSLSLRWFETLETNFIAWKQAVQHGAA